MVIGTGASGGIGIGRVMLVREQKPVYERRRIRDTKAELKKLREAVKSFVKATEELADKVMEEAGEKEAGILRGHIILLKDPVMISEVEKLINGGECAEAAVEQICNMFISVFSAVDDELTRQRAADLEDLKSRLIKHLIGMDEVRLSPLPEGTVVCAKELTPSMTASLDRKNVAGIITEKGAENSHCAILARALDIPAVVAAKGITSIIKNGEDIILDGESGEIIHLPDEKTKKEYEQKKKAYYSRRELLRSYRGSPTLNVDGDKLSVFCNVGSVGDADRVVDGDGEGIGLFRTEFLFLDRKTRPSEQEQFEAYRAAAIKMKGRPVVISTFDMGGDKEVPCLELDEKISFLGMRAIRFFNYHPEVLRTQLRAILRASAFGDVRILVPMISDIEELRFVREMLEQLKDGLRSEGIVFNENIWLGIMIETPSACMIADMLAKEADFFSIGTNDLTQYTMAADRDDPSVSYLCSVFKPSVLRSIKYAVACAKKQGIMVEICGEAAANRLMTPLLLSYGLDTFSVDPSSVLMLRKEISHYTKERADELARAVDEMTTSAEIKEFLTSQLYDKNA